jgi:tetratricopeptide (TPR) repeat protein
MTDSRKYPRVRPAWVVCAWLIITTVAVTAPAEDTLETGNRVYRGTVIKADAQTVMIEMDGGNQIGVPRGSILRAWVERPENIAAGLAAFAEGKMQQAYTALRGVVPRFVGLDVDWEVSGTMAYGRAATALRKYEKAEKIFLGFLKLHPEHPLRISAHLGRAGIRVAEGKHEEALKSLLPLSASFDKSVKPEGNRRALAAEAFLGVGKAQEGLSRLEEALEAYLKVVAIYPEPVYYEEALYRSAALRVQLGRDETALAAINELLEDFPDSAYRNDALDLKNGIERRLES